MTEELKLDELELLKGRADDMGLKYHPSISLDKLKAKIEEANAPKEEPVVAKASGSKTRQEHVKEATKLIRIRIVNMNPNKREWQGEFFSASNRVVGTIKKYVPYDVEWHVPNFIFKMIKARKFRVTKEVSNGKGGKITQNRFLPEFSVEVLPDLTPAELKELAADQAKRGAVDKD
jgi:hypothetical protein